MMVISHIEYYLLVLGAVLGLIMAIGLIFVIAIVLIEDISKGEQKNG